MVSSTASSRSLTKLLKDSGHNPNSKKDADLAKAKLKGIGIDYTTGKGLEKAAYLREHYVIPAERYEEARQILIQDNAAITSC